MPGVDTTIGTGAGGLVFTTIGEDPVTPITGMATLAILTTTPITATITPIIHIHFGGRQGLTLCLTMQTN